MNNLIQMRTIKIQPFIIPSTTGRPTRVKPLIKLVGDWLSFAGFKPGDMATIIIKDGVMTIKPEGKAAKMRA
jgi:hypothetical protein